MGINPRTKGASGEREIADTLNFLIYRAMQRLGYPEAECLKAMSTVQRNQNQSAVGGNDLSNVLGLSIEVKRQETLAIPEWWRQCLKAAERNNEVPVLIYRQNRKPWKVRTYLWANLPGGRQTQVVGEMEFENFKNWFSVWAELAIQHGAEVRT